MNTTYSEMIRTCTEDYIKGLSPADKPVPQDMEKELVNICRDTAILNNASRGKSDKLKVPPKLNPWQIAMLMLTVNNVVKVKAAGSAADESYDLLAIYCESGENEGIYITDDTEFSRRATEYDYNMSEREFNEVLRFLRMYAKRVERATDRDLIAVNNGIFNYATKQLEPFSPDRIFLSKSRVDYNPNALNVTIHNDGDGTDWDVESWMAELSDDPEVVEVLWEILGAILRPHVRWNKSAWLYSSTGNNGKGTLCELMRSLCGEDCYAAIPLVDFSKDFALEPLVRAQAIIVDENDVGAFIDKVANLKAIITNDVIPINRKFKTPISYQFYGFMVQCLNEFPRIRDKSDSFYRRQLFIPFEKCFTGVERKYIKNDYLHRPEVLEYVMYRVLNMNFYELSEPLSCRNALEDYKESNDPVRQFWNEMEEQFAWDLLPFDFLYALYKAWFRQNNPSGTIEGKNTFITNIRNVIKSSRIWYNNPKTVRTKGRMDRPEPLIAEYDLGDWKNPTYIGSDINRISTPKLGEYHSGGLLRCGQADDEDAD